MKIFLLLLWAVTWNEWDVCKESTSFGIQEKACLRPAVACFDSLSKAKEAAKWRREEAPKVIDVKVYELREIE